MERDEKWKMKKKEWLDGIASEMSDLELDEPKEAFDYFSEQQSRVKNWGRQYWNPNENRSLLRNVGAVNPSRRHQCLTLAIRSQRVHAKQYVLLRLRASHCPSTAPTVLKIWFYFPQWLNQCDNPDRNN